MKTEKQDQTALLVDLESRLSFQEDMLQALNHRVAEQDKEIATLQLQLKHLNDKIKSASEESYGQNTADERPPHY